MRNGVNIAQGEQCLKCVFILCAFLSLLKRCRFPSMYIILRKSKRQICLNSYVSVDTDVGDSPPHPTPLYIGFWCQHLPISRSLIKAFHFLGVKARSRDKSEQVENNSLDEAHL